MIRTEERYRPKYGLVNKRARCSVCNEGMPEYGYSFFSLKHDWKRHFICDHCFEILKLCRDNFDAEEMEV